MPKYLKTLGNSVIGIGVCDRCKFKAATVDLMPDPNTPGLRVHKRCADEFDPYRLPALQDDRINLPFVRPDLPLDGTNDIFSILEFLTTQDDIDYITEDGFELRTDP